MSIKRLNTLRGRFPLRVGFTLGRFWLGVVFVKEVGLIEGKFETSMFPLITTQS